jgi:polar amino acid transport system ATP-binding protein
MALDAIDLDVASGEIVALIGPSGCGKSTLLRCLAQLEVPDSGIVLLEGKPFGTTADGARRQSPRTIDAIRPRIGFVFQSLNLWPHMSALDNVAKALISVRRMPAAAALQRAQSLVEQFGMAQKASRRPADLSGGERQRIAICRALAMEPAALLFDEPTSALDPELVLGVRDVLRQLAGTGIGMVIATHDLGFAKAASDRLIFLEKGRVVETGDTQTTLAAPKTERLQSFIQSVTHI